MKYLILLAASLLTTISYGQSKKFSFQLGSAYSLPRKSDDLSFFGNEKDGIVNLSLKKDELNITRFDPKTLNLTVEKKIELPELTKKFNSETVVDFGTNYFWIHSDWDKGAEKELLSYDAIDVVNGKIITSNKKMIETTKIIPPMDLKDFFKPKVYKKYEFNYDADKSKLLVSYRLKPEETNDKKNYDKIGLHVFGDKMDKLWGAEFTMPYTEAIMDNADFSIDSKGNAYMLAKVYDSEKRREKDKETGQPGYHYEVLKFSKDNKKIITTNITIDDYFIRETTLIENSLHEMVIACTYSKKSNGNGTDGVFLAMMGQNGKMVKYKNGYYEFPLAELEKFESARKKRKMERKNDYEAPNLKVRNVIVESDGSVLIACEEYHEITRSKATTNSNGMSGSSYTTYYYEDILAAKINAAGNFEWLRKIPKKQEGTNGRGTMSFKLISDASGYYYLFLDNKKNIDLEENEVPKSHVDGYGGQVVVAKIDNKGLVTKEIVFDTREEEVKLFPASFDRINGNQFIGRADVKHGDYKPLLITVN